MPTNPGEILIDDSTNNDLLFDVKVDGETKAKGLIERDYNAHPIGSYASTLGFRAVNMPLIPRSEWSARIKEGEQSKSFLSHYRLTGNKGQMIDALDQNGQGYCWAYSSTSCVMMLRCTMNQPHVRLSAHAIGCMVKNFRDQGGWGAQSLDFISSKGVPSVQHWPEKSMSRGNDKPETWANAALYKVTDGWVDLQAAQYDRNLSWDQVMTLLLCRVPVVGDFNWWGHSVCLLDPVEVEPGSFGVRILNSWSNSWSDRGMGVLRGNKAVPDGSVAPKVTLASAA